MVVVYVTAMKADRYLNSIKDSDVSLRVRMSVGLLADLLHKLDRAEVLTFYCHTWP